MVILQIHVADFALLDVEGDTPIARRRNAPGSRTVAGQLMDAPTGRTDNPRDVLCSNQRRQDVAHAADQVLTDAAVVVIFDEAPQAAMADASDIHFEECTVLQYANQA